MSKTLSNILTVFKVAKVIAKVVFILCIIGAAGCLLALISLSMLGNSPMLPELFDQVLDLPSVYWACAVGIIACVGEAILAFLSERYFKNVLRAQTPFTLEGARESFRLGIASIIISLAVSLLVGVVAGAILLFTSQSPVESDVSTSISLSTGLFFLFLSLIFKHGAELKKGSEEAEAKKETEPSDVESK